MDDLTMRHQEPSLLIRLYRHRPQRHHTPRENYVTEAFAAVLSTDRELLKAFFQRVAGEFVPDTACIDTQVRGDTGVFDIVVSRDDFYYVIESKFIAPSAAGAGDEGGHQLERYADEIARRYEARKGIISITLGSHPAIELPVSLFKKTFDLFKQEGIPPELWLYVGNRLRSCFSNRSFSQFQKEVIYRLQLQGIEPLQEPPRIWKTYQNILCLDPEKLKVHGDATQQPRAPDRLKRASPASAGR